MIKIRELLKKDITLYFLVALLCSFIFGCIYGFKILNPTYIDWIFERVGDISQHYVGWEAYRLGRWTFPIGVTNMVSYPTYISVMHTDSIPILAFFFKLVSFLLPKTFQYLGLYGFICFILQGILCSRIIKYYTDSKLYIIVSTVFFTIVPSMLFRMFYHTALASQWLLLLAFESIFLYDKYNNKKIYVLWAIIGFLVVTIHLYYLVMCGIILIGYIVMDILETKKLKRSIILLGIYIVVALITLWLLGGFVNLGKSDNFGFGLFSYNLNGLINSQGYSYFLNPLPMLGEQYEGFSYLGFGVIILSIIALGLGIRWLMKDRKIFKRRKNLIICLLVISVICTFVALSPDVYWGENLLYRVPLPSFILNIWGIFRSTGRFIWPVIYIITLVSIIVVMKRLNYKTALIILSLCALIQVRDIYQFLIDTHDFYSHRIEFSERDELSHNRYLNKVISNNINLVVMVSKDFYTDKEIMYADWALNHGMMVNRFHFARQSFDDTLLKNTNAYLEKKDKNTIFLFTTKRECLAYELNCYKINNDLSLGYINKLD